MNRSLPSRIFLPGCLLVWACQAPPDSQSGDSDPPEPRPTGSQIVLFDGKTLEGWEVTAFGGEGEVLLDDGHVRLAYGSPLTGIHRPDWGDLPTQDYSLALTASRISGTDFFCGLTFPVGKSFCTLVLGGWGGSLSGLSCLDDHDASSNETCRFLNFERGHSYRVRVEIRPERLRAWLDDEMIVDQDIRGRRVSLRTEVELSAPFGVASYVTTARIGPITLTPLPKSGP